MVLNSRQAAGKGVILPTSKSEAIDALKSIMLQHEFGGAGNEVVIEEYLRVLLH